jgi:hypothetical protein
VLAQALELAAAGAIWPLAFAVTVGLLSGDEPIKRSFVFLAGAAFISLVGFVVIIVFLRTLSLTPSVHPYISVAIKVVLGIVLLALGIRTLWRRRQQTEAVTKAAEPEKGDGENGRRSLWPVFVSGVVVYFPGVFLVASARTIADAREGILSTYLTAAICVIVLLAFAELPVLAYAIAPGRVGPVFDNVIGWAKRHSAQLILAIELIGGVYLLAGGIHTLATPA